MRRILLFSLLTFIFLSFFSVDAQARRGCCSHHGGVNYCDRNQGRYVCNDGTYSPTCGCEMEQTPNKKSTQQSTVDDQNPYLSS